MPASTGSPIESAAPTPSRISPVLADSALVAGTTVLVAAAGALFWVIAARLHDQATIGVAGSLIQAVVVLGLVSQLGLNITLIRALPQSATKGSDVMIAMSLTAAVGFLLGLVYALVVPLLAGELGVLHDPGWHVLAFAVVVGGTAANITSDAAFLSTRKVGWNLAINGLGMGLVKCVLPFVFLDLAGFGLLLSVGLASTCAAVVSLLALLRTIGGRRNWRPSPALRGSVGFSLAGYLTSVLDLIPIMVLPLIVLTTLGAEQAGAYTIVFQMATLLNAGIYAIGSSAFAEGSRHPERRRAVMRHGGGLILAAVTLGVVGLGLLAEPLLRLFGPEFATGTSTLRWFAVAGFAVALNYWCMIRLRLMRHLRGMVSVPLVGSTVMLLAAQGWADRGLDWVAISWLGGQTCAAVAGLLLGRGFADEPTTIAEFHGGEPNAR